MTRALAVLLFATPHLHAVTIRVAGKCTLVSAIRAANLDRPIRGCRAGDHVQDVIVLRPGSVHRLRRPSNAVYGPTALPVVSSNIIIRGNRATIVRPPRGANMRLFTVSPAGLLMIDNMTVRGGYAAYRHRGHPIARMGGAIFNRGALRVVNTTIGSSRAYARGGAIYSEGRNLAISNSTISFNRAHVAGGGIEARDVFIRIENSTISDNSSSWGGGLAIFKGNVFGASTTTHASIINSTISGNSVSSFDGGGILAGAGARLVIEDSTIVRNIAGRRGGGIYVESLDAQMQLTRTLITINKIRSDEEIWGSDGVEIWADSSIIGNHNLIGHAGLTTAAAIGGNYRDDLFAGANNIIPTADSANAVHFRSILHEFIKHNGGSTQTHALIEGSPAIDAVMDGTCPPPDVDQRGIERAQDGNLDGGPACDIGAFEFVADAPPVTPYRCGGLAVTIPGTSKRDILHGTDGPDVINSLGGNDLIFAYEGDDVICSGPGNDVVRAGFGADRIFGGTDNDRLFSEHNNDIAFGGPGNDAVAGGFGNDRVDGSIGIDHCNGGPDGGDTAFRCEQIRNVP